MKSRNISFFKICILAAALFIFLSLPLFALELKEGRVKIILQENSGKFTAYYLTDIGKSKYTPFFLDQDPRTTVLSIGVGNKVYRMGETSAFRQTIESTDAGAKYIWRSSQLEVSEDFSFISSSNSAIPDGFKITITLKNISEDDISVGARYLFDTYLGEESGTHFKTDTIAKVTGETSFSKYAIPEYIVSPNGNTQGFQGFQIMTKASGITTPDSVVLANWKRLNDSTWSYDVRSSRNFNNLPYSINDSGAMFYYNEQRISSGSSREIVMAMGAYTPNGFTAQNNSAKSELADVFDKTLQTDTASSAQNTDLSVRTDLLTITDLLKKINQKLESGEKISASELEVMRKVVDELKKRKTRYDSE